MRTISLCTDCSKKIHKNRGGRCWDCYTKSGFGKDINDIQAADEWHLGYIRKEIAKVLRETGIIIPNQKYEAKFLINFSGKPMVSFDEI